MSAGQLRPGSPPHHAPKTMCHISHCAKQGQLTDRRTLHSGRLWPHELCQSAPLASCSILRCRSSGHAEEPVGLGKNHDCGDGPHCRRQVGSWPSTARWAEFAAVLVVTVGLRMCGRRHWIYIYHVRCEVMANVEFRELLSQHFHHDETGKEPIFKDATVSMSMIGMCVCLTY